MTNSVLFWFAAIACVVVLAILLFGIGTFAKGGDFNKKYANKIMRARLAAQFVAVILIVGFAYLASRGG
ncbi:MAG: twin transmembrane helix small protein [Pseudomonadota bacterium]